jgi:hypothetical protein
MNQFLISVINNFFRIDYHAAFHQQIRMEICIQESMSPFRKGSEGDLAPMGIDRIPNHLPFAKGKIKNKE